MAAEPNGLASLSLTLSVLVLVLWAAVWIVRRWRPGAGGAGASDCAVLRSLVLGPRERLVVVRVGGKQLVLGIAGGAVSLLCELDEKLPAVGRDAVASAIGRALKSWRGA